MFRFDCTFSNFNCTKRVQLHTILRPDADNRDYHSKQLYVISNVAEMCDVSEQVFFSEMLSRYCWYIFRIIDW